LNACGGRRAPTADPPLLIAAGRLKAGPEAALFAAWNARLRPPFTVLEVPEGRGTPAEIRRREGAAMMAALPERGLAVALDLGGEAPCSEDFARMVERWRGIGRRLAFLVGGAEGLDPAVLARAEARLSLGPMTWPHMLVRALLAEQMFRAQAILSGHPYHRGWRP
jgi:23S rRNA (pseudouridine1915-N3)-methyltransferase